jgi:hypothetical protein
MWGNEGDMALKLYMSKAYDQELKVLEGVVRKMGFACNWIQLVMNRVRTVNYVIIVNGSLVERIVPAKIIRQGYPLSPYLFSYVWRL